jgi:hypothetical protein
MEGTAGASARDEPHSGSGRTQLHLAGFLIETGTAVLIAALFLEVRGLRTFVETTLVGLWRAAVSLGSVSLSDPPTIFSGLIAFSKLGLAWIPALLWARRVRWRHGPWLVIIAVAMLLVSALSWRSYLRVSRWILLAATSGIAFACVRRRRFWPAVLAPFLVLAEPNWMRTPLAALIWGEAQLADACRSNDGARPANATDDLNGIYYGVTKVDDEHVFVSGHRLFGEVPAILHACLWAARQGEAFTVEHFSAMLAHRMVQHAGWSNPFVWVETDRLWNTCVLDDYVFVADHRDVMGVRYLGPGSRMFEKLVSVDPAVARAPLDSLSLGCDASRHTLLMGDEVNGQVHEWSPTDRTMRDFAFDGARLEPLPLKDGRLVVVDQTRLTLFDRDRAQVLQQLTAGAEIVNARLCESDGAVATADALGRLREFKPDSSGQYRFAWGLSLPAPAHLAWSPDCTHLAVASDDGSSVFIVDRETRTVGRTFHVGPGLGSVAFMGPKELVAADSCTLEDLRF